MSSFSNNFAVLADEDKINRKKTRAAIEQEEKRLRKQQETEAEKSGLEPEKKRWAEISDSDDDYSECEYSDSDGERNASEDGDDKQPEVTIIFKEAARKETPPAPKPTKGPKKAAKKAEPKVKAPKAAKTPKVVPQKIDVSENEDVKAAVAAVEKAKGEVKKAKQTERQFKTSEVNRLENVLKEIERKAICKAKSQA